MNQCQHCGAVNPPDPEHAMHNRMLRLRAQRAFGAMPYGGIASILRSPRMAGEPDSWEMIVTNLERLRSALEGVAESNQHEQDELALLQGDLAAVRRLIGRVA